MNPCLVALLACTVIAGAGCTAGRNFERPADDSLSLGKTTRSEIVARFGKPAQEGTLVQNGQTVKSAVYSFARGGIGSGALHVGVTPARAIAFSFAGDLLVGYDFVSSFEADHTDFNDAKVVDLKEGQTSRQEVLTLLGPPHGRQKFPLVDREEDAGLVYQYAHFKAPSAFYRKQLVIWIGPDERVRKVTFTEFGAK